MERAHHQILLHTEEFRTDIVNIEFQPSPMILHILHQVHRSVLYIYIYIYIYRERERERERERVWHLTLPILKVSFLIHTQTNHILIK